MNAFSGKHEYLHKMQYHSIQLLLRYLNLDHRGGVANQHYYPWNCDASMSKTIITRIKKEEMALS